MNKPPAAADRKRESDGTAGGWPRKRARSGGNCDGDLISRLPDAILGTVISLLLTKDGACTQAISRRWRHLWRSAPLNLEAGIGLSHDVLERAAIVSRILADHPGPARRFYYPFIRHTNNHAEVDGWFHSRALASLQELDISFERIWARPQKDYRLASSVLRLAPTLLVAKIGSCDFPKEIMPLLDFPLLKQLTLQGVSTSEEVFHGVLSGCRALESLLLWVASAFAR